MKIVMKTILLVFRFHFVVNKVKLKWQYYILNIFFKCVLLKIGHANVRSKKCCLH